jgi:hypothetical protein
MSKKIRLLIIGLFLFHVSFGQGKKNLMFSFGIGVISSPANHRIQAPSLGMSYFLNTNYIISNHYTIAIDYTSGSHEYTSNIYDSSTSLLASKIQLRALSLIFKYKILDKNYFSIDIGTGFSLLHSLHRHPIYEGIKDNLSFKEMRFFKHTDLAFPFKLEFNFSLASNWTLGVDSGLFLAPVTYPLVGISLCPRLSYIIK